MSLTGLGLLRGELSLRNQSAGHAACKTTGCHTGLSLKGVRHTRTSLCPGCTRVANSTLLPLGVQANLGKGEPLGQCFSPQAWQSVKTRVFWGQTGLCVCSVL